MSIEATPLDVMCPAGCTYCYQKNQRDASGNTAPRFDREATWAGLVRAGVGRTGAKGQIVGFALFGGEPLLIPKDDLVWFADKAQSVQAPVKIQTMGQLITPWHLDWIAKYKIGVGISIDGGGGLNDARRVGSIAHTRAMTERTEAAIAALCQSGHRPSLIVTLSTMNAAAGRLADLVAWVTAVVGQGVRNINFHPLEVDSPSAASLRLSEPDALAAADALRPLGRRLKARFQPWEDIRTTLSGGEAQNCVWHACDPYVTNAVQGVNGQGQSRNCGRTNKDGVAWVKADKTGHERQLALYLTPQDAGGCQGCRFFAFCQGECPGTGLAGDWRAKTEHCGVLQHTFGAIEREIFESGGRPLSQSLQRARIEADLLAGWQGAAAQPAPKATAAA